MNTTLEKMWRLGILSVVAFQLLLGFSPAAPNEPSFTTIDFPGATFTVAFAINPAGEINPAGQIVGLYFDANDVGHGFLLSNGSFTTIDPAGATFAAAEGINPAGQIVGEYDDANGVKHGFC